MSKSIKIALAALAVVGTGATAQARELTYNSFLPAGEPVNSQGMVPFWERIAEDTGGAYTGKMFYAGQMFGPTEVLEGIKEGAVDSGHVQPTGFVADMPYAAAVAEMQGFALDPVVAAAAMEETYFLNCPQCEDEQKRNDIVTLAGTVTQPLHMVCSKEVNSAADLKGLRLMTVLRAEQSVARHFEMTPVSLSFNEMLPSLQRGAIDCIMTMDSWFPAFQLQDMVKSIVAARSFGAAPVPNFLTLSREVWDEMDEDTRAIFLDNAIRLTADLATMMRDSAKEARAYAVENGVKEAQMDAAFIETYEVFIAADKADIERSFESFGLDDLGPLIDAFRTSYAKWEEMIPADVDAATFAEMLKTNIYDKASF